MVSFLKRQIIFNLRGDCVRKLEAVIFDMDGVIFDSERLYLESCIQAGKKYHLKDIESVCKDVIGLTFQKTKESFFQAYGEDFPCEEFWKSAQEIARDKINHGEMIMKSGVKELLIYLSENRIPTALASSTVTSKVRQHLEQAGIIQYFDEIVCGDTVSQGKPSPEIYLKTAELLGKSPEKCFALEDSFNGIRSAYNAGMAVIMIPDILQPTEEIKSVVNAVLPSLVEVKEYLQTYYL